MTNEFEGLQNKQFFDSVIAVNLTFPIAIKTELVGEDGVDTWIFRFTLQTYGVTLSYDLKIRADETCGNERTLSAKRNQLIPKITKVFVEKRKDRDVFCAKLSHHLMLMFRLPGTGSVYNELVIEKIIFELTLSADW